MTAFEQQDEIGNFVAESATITFNGPEEAHAWMKKCRQVYLASLRRDSNMVRSFISFMNRADLFHLKYLIYCTISKVAAMHCAVNQQDS